MGNKFWCFIFLLMLALPFVFAQINPASLDGGLEKVEDAKEKIDEYSDVKRWEEKWDYLGTKGKEILLKNKFVSGADKIFTKISVVFLVLFGQPYSLSLVLFFVIVLWLFVFFNLGNILKSWGIVGQGVLPFVGALLLTVGLAWTKALVKIVSFAGKLIFSPEYWWTRVIVGIFIIAGIVLLQFAFRYLSVFLAAKKLVAKAHATEVSQKLINKFAEKLGKASAAKDMAA
jgi:hypothetical protein